MIIQAKFKETELGEIPDGWEVKELGEVCQLVKKQYNPSKKDVRAYIGLEHIEQQNLKLISIGSSEDIDSNKFEFKAGQILFGKLRPYFRKVYRPKFDGVCSTDIWVIDSKNQFDNGFLFYFLADQRIINEANNSSEGTKMPRARWDYLSRLKFAFPSISEQRAIASILSSLDDKIALNHWMNSTLESIGQALFRHWFIDFEFPDEEGKPYRSSGGEMVETELGEVPRGWRVGTVADLCVSITNGGTPKRMESRFWDGGTIPWYKTGELFDEPLLDSEEHITEEGLKESSCHLWEQNTVLIALYASPTVGRLGLLRTRGTANQACSGLVAKPDVGYAFLFFTLLFKRDGFNMIAVGSAQQNISQQIVKDQKIIIPPPEMTLNFQKSIEPFFERNTSNIAESLTLAALRDTLLPKLMSGEIRVGAT